MEPLQSSLLFPYVVWPVSESSISSPLVLPVRREGTQASLARTGLQGPPPEHGTMGKSPMVVCPGKQGA